jgi:phenylalanyl-tRNA synthetase alpha chain
MQEQVQALKLKAEQDLQAVNNLDELEKFRLNYLTKKGPVQTLLRQLGDLAPELRKMAGELINQARDQIEQAYEQLKLKLQSDLLEQRIKAEALDITLPGRKPAKGSLHPVMQTLDKILDILSAMGFCTHMGCNVDDDYHNFESLNFPEGHPARDMQDTYYLENGQLLRTQTSNMQVRLMKQLGAPLRVAMPGRCFRSETITARSHIMFHQVEGLYIDQKVNMGDLLATLELFYRHLFQEKVEIRVRPSYFPFVEPGIEVDVSCVMCHAKGCSICKHSGWLEVAGAGMVHPNVLRAGGIDPELYSGFAWGMGIERLVMILKGIDDIRLFTQNDVRFLNQFKTNS